MGTICRRRRATPLTPKLGFGVVVLVMLVAWVASSVPPAAGGAPCRARRCVSSDASASSDDDTGTGTWYWVRSPDEERRAVASLYNRYCIRCHGVDGRGVWDIPDVPNFTSTRWQSYRSDGQLARLTLEGRGAVMPPFRGTLSLEEACAMARYLRTFVPGTEISRPDTDKSDGATAKP